VGDRHVVPQHRVGVHVVVHWMRESCQRNLGWSDGKYLQSWGTRLFSTPFQLSKSPGCQTRNDMIVFSTRPYRKLSVCYSRPGTESHPTPRHGSTVLRDFSKSLRKADEWWLSTSEPWIDHQSVRNSPETLHTPLHASSVLCLHSTIQHES
jgi:hypothetical protein